MTARDHGGIGQVEVRLATPEDAATIHGLIQRTFTARSALSPPADALSDNEEDIRRRLGEQTGLVATVDGRAVGCLFVSVAAPASADAMVYRVAVLPEKRRQGIATSMVMAAGEYAVFHGCRRLVLTARRELPDTVQWWRDNGFEIVAEIDRHSWLMAIDLPWRYLVGTAEQMRALGAALVPLLRAGDVIVASGELGSGKTTLTQGLGAALGVRGVITSPTFVLSRIHPTASGPSLIHVDAYRLGSAAELDDIDLDISLADSITLIEWGAGLAEQLSSDRLEIWIRRSDDPGDDTRVVDLAGVGPRWEGVCLGGLEIGVGQEDEQ